MPDPFLSRLDRRLAPSRYRRRLLRELEQHIEDSGGDSGRLGTPEVVAELYHRAYPFWPRVLAFLVLAFVTSALIFTGAYVLRIDETPAETAMTQSPFGWIVGLGGLVGIFLMLPGIYASAAIFFPSQNFDAHFMAAPMIANIVWMLIYAVFLLPPPLELLRHLVRRFKS